MTPRAVPASLDAEVVAEIDERLAAVEAGGARVLLAVESGSRAWGFPSPDSDYDCRFLFVRREADYLSLWSPRDVIETPLDEVFDVNGWDVGKAIRLIVKGNATAIEWLRSPIVYRGDAEARDALLAFAAEVAPRQAIARHYLHVARRQLEGATSLKRFLYALRPAFALRWLAEHPESGLPPMALPALVEQTTAAAAVVTAVDKLIELKSHTRELGGGEVPDALRRFVDEELARAEPVDDATGAAGEVQHPGVRELADELFRSLVAARAS